MNEQVVIASLAVDAETRDAWISKFETDTFLIPQHRLIFASLREMHRRKLTYDPATLKILGLGDGEIRYLDMLVAARPESSANLSAHVDALFWDKCRHTASTGPVSALVEALRDPRETPERVRALANSIPSVFSSYKERTHIHDPKQLVHEQMDAIRKRRGGKGFVPFGIMGLDYYELVEGEPLKPRLIPGARRKLTTVVVGTSGSGKTTLCANMANGLRSQKRRGAFFAWEINGGTALELMASIDLGLSREVVNLGYLTQDQEDQIEAKMHEIAADVAFMSNPWQRKSGQRVTNDTNLDQLQSYIADTGAEWIIIDLWRRALRKFDPDEEESALYRQQSIAQELDIHQILVQQIRGKDLEARPDKIPTRESIKGSFSWIEVPDTILAVHRPALWNPSKIEDKMLQVFVLKQRDGKWPIGIEFEWEPEFGLLRGGKSIPYIQTDETSSTRNEVDAAFSEPKHGSKKWSRGRRV